MKIVLASGNRNKYVEMKEALAPAGVELVFGGDFRDPVKVDEDGSTYSENALLKARAWAGFTGLPAISDDSGLEVKALGGLPGIRSARIVSGGDEARTRWLLDSLGGGKDREARFVCCIAAVFPDDGREILTEKYCYGKIAEIASGTSGFGYDPVFIPEGYDRTFAELGREIKNKISHRAFAVKSIAEKLKPVIEYYTVRAIKNNNQRRNEV